MPYLALAHQIADILADQPAVVAVALGGSRGNGGLGAAPGSDLDLEVYTDGEVPLEAREAMVRAIGGALPGESEMDNRFWGTSDEFVHAPTGIGVDVTYFDAAWMADRLDAVLVRHEASLGYTTCFWHTIRGCIVLADRRGWLHALKERAAVPYPEELRTAIVRLNHPVLRAAIPAYANQLAKATERGDLVSVNHRLAGLLASWFDLVFAVNRVPHPGEKRLIEAVRLRCASTPAQYAEDVMEILGTATTDPGGLAGRIGRLLDRTDAWLRAEGFDAASVPSLAPGP